MARAVTVSVRFVVSAPEGEMLNQEPPFCVDTAAMKLVGNGSVTLSVCEGGELPPSVARKRGEELLALLERAASEPVGQALEPPPGKPTPEETRLIGRLMEAVREQAGHLGISPEVLATRRDVEALARGSRDGSPLLRGWRCEAIGQRLLDALEAR